VSKTRRKQKSRRDKRQLELQQIGFAIGAVFWKVTKRSSELRRAWKSSSRAGSAEKAHPLAESGAIGARERGGGVVAGVGVETHVLLDLPF